jgi:hypothetical protein
MTNSDSSVGDSWIAKVTAYFGFYLIYVFISGWTFGEFYFRELGLSPRWLDLSIYDILTTGFTVLLTGGKWLWPFYLAVLVIPILLERSSWSNRLSVRLTTAVLLFAVLFPIYFISRSAGIQQSSIEKDPKSSRLPVMTFSSKDGKKYVGKLLYLKDGTYYVREVKAVDSANTDEAAVGLTLSVYRAEEIHDVKVVGYP